MRTGRDMGHESSPCRLKPQTWTGSKEQRTMAPAPKCRLEKRDGRKSRIGEDEEGPRVKSQNLLGERLFTAVPAMEKSVKERPQNRPLDVISLGDGGHKAQEGKHRLLSLGQGWAGLLPGGMCNVGTGRVRNFRGNLLPGNGKSTAVLWSVASEWMGGETVGPGVSGSERRQRG